MTVDPMPMNKKGSLSRGTSARKKIASVFLGLILSLVLLEVGLRLGGFVLSSMQEYGNLQSIKQKGTYRILCLGESTTQRQYPQYLEQVLNQRNIGVRFSVIDRGKAGTNTPAILSRVESYLAEYHPDMVVAMMGNNDQGIKYYQDISESLTWIFQHCRVYRFGRILCMQLLKKFQKKDIYDSGRADFERKPRGDDPGTAMAKAGPKNDRVDLEFKKAIELDPKNDKVYVEMGRLYQFRGKYSRAEISFRRAIALNPENDDAYAGLGMLFQDQDKLSQAEASFKKAIEINPKNDKARIELERLYRFRDKFSKVETSFKKAIELNPQNDKAYAELGRLYKDQGKFQQARDFYGKAIEINPKNDKACIELGRLYHTIGQWRLTEDFLRKALETNPKNDMAYVELGQLYRDQGKSPQAEEPFKRAIELNPENFLAFFELGVLYRDQGKLSQAEDSFRRALGIRPQDERTLGAMASLYEEMGKRELAKEYTEKAGQLGWENQTAVTVNNYRKLKNILDRKGIKLVCVQYPVRNVEPLKRIFGNDEGVIFVDNERVFKEAVKRSDYKEYFRDMFAGDFGHCTQKGNELLAQNIADVILKEVFDK
jgi:tetratricopeptide (TPR) repeat protein